MHQHDFTYARAVLRCAVLCCAVLCCAVLCCAVLLAVNCAVLSWAGSAWWGGLSRVVKVLACSANLHSKAVK